MGHVFISYAREDFQWAGLIHQQLEKSGFELFFQSPDLRFYPQWQESVDRALADAFAVIIIVTAYAAKSSFVEYEWNRAEELGVPIVPVIFAHSGVLLPRYRPLGELDFTLHNEYPWRGLTRALIRAAQKMPWKVAHEQASQEQVGEHPVVAPPSSRPNVPALSPKDAQAAAQPFMQGGWSELSAGHLGAAQMLFNRAAQFGLKDGEAERWAEFSRLVAVGLELADQKRYTDALADFNAALKLLTQERTTGTLNPWVDHLRLHLVPARKMVEIWIQRTGEAISIAQQAASVPASSGSMRISLNELSARDQLEVFHHQVKRALKEPEATQPLPKFDTPPASKPAESPEIRPAAPDIVLRLMEASDIPIITGAFEAIGWNKPASQYERYLTEQNESTRQVIVAFRENTFVGYATINWKSDYTPFRESGIPEIQDLNVLPHFQRRGFGTALLNEAERRVSYRTSTVGIGVGMYADYGPAQRMYTLRGYVPDGRGLVSANQWVRPGDRVLVDDGLVLYFTKHLWRQSTT